MFDLATGQYVDWLALFPNGATLIRSVAADGSPVDLVASIILVRHAAARAMRECAATYAGHPQLGFSIGLDARTGALTAIAPGLPHAAQVCAVNVSLRPDELARLGFAPRLVNALRAARAPTAGRRVR